MTSIERERPDQPDALRLLAQADARAAALYVPEGRHGLGPAELVSRNVRFYVARIGGQAVGCGGYAVGPNGFAELKRLFVLAEARGNGLGQSLVAALEHASAGERARVMQLETGVKSHEALRLYRRLGYVARGPFGEYRPDPVGVFMEKILPALPM